MLCHEYDVKSDEKFHPYSNTDRKSFVIQNY